MGNQISVSVGKNRSVGFWKNPALMVFVFSSGRRNLIVVQLEKYLLLLVQCCSPYLNMITLSGQWLKRGRIVSSIGLGSFFFLLPVFGAAQGSWKYDHLLDIVGTQIKSVAADHGIRWVWFCSTVDDSPQANRIWGFDTSGRLSADYESDDNGHSYWRYYFFYDDCGQKVRFETAKVFGDGLSNDSLPDRMVDEEVYISEDSISYAEGCLPLSSYSPRAVGDDLMNYVGTLERMPDSVRITYVTPLSDTTVVVYDNDGLMIRRMIKRPRKSSRPGPGSFRYLESKHAYDVLEAFPGDKLRIQRYYIDQKGRLRCGRYGRGAGSLAFRFKYLPGTSLVKEARYYLKNGDTYYWFRVEYSEGQLPIKVIDMESGGFSEIRYRFY